MATPRVKEFATAALMNLSRELDHLLLDLDAPPWAKEYAAEALCNISEDPANLRALVAAGVDFQFMELLDNGTASPRAIEYAQRGLHNCCKVPFN